MAEEKIICPSPEELQYKGSVHCPVEGCGKELPSSSCLRMHLSRRHHGKPLERSSGSCANTSCVEFYCPVRGCNRSREGGKPFSKLNRLRRHYQDIHGQNNNLCVHCGRKFALIDECNRHQQECQQKIVCLTCGLDFHSRNALYQHAKRKGHTLPEGKISRSTLKGANSKSVVLIPIPTSVKVVVPIPKNPRVVTTCTQTDAPGITLLGLPPTEVELQSSSCQTTSDLSLNLLCLPSEVLSLGIQTNIPSEKAVVSTQACQTQSTQLCDIGTQTHKGTSHVVLPSNTSDSATCTSNGISCCSDSLTHNGVEFGTQTPCSEPYIISESDMVDFGTQTIGMSHLELDDSLFSRHLLPPECLDFGTQTLEFPYDYVSHSVQTCLQGSDTKDQSSQT